MKHVSGTYRDGMVELDQTVDWPDGTVVEVVDSHAINDRDFLGDGIPYPGTPAGREELLHLMDNIQPLTLTDDEADEIEWRHQKWRSE
jgi:hypothetical protein